jgi:hypothetical protein
LRGNQLKKNPEIPELKIYSIFIGVKTYIFTSHFLGFDKVKRLSE